MKQLLLIRHAKSSWDFDVDDFDRPLNNRGKQNAPEMAKRLLKKEVRIDKLISSPAKRAFATASLFAEVYEIRQKKIVLLDYLYEPSLQAFADAIAQADDDSNSIAVFSHNPGITDFANGLTEVRIDDMPTCAIFCVKAAVNSWKDFMDAPKEFVFFDYPKSE